MILEPLENARGLDFADRPDACPPALPKRIHVTDEIAQRFDARDGEVACKRRLEPRCDSVVCAWRLRHQALQPEKRVELFLNEASATLESTGALAERFCIRGKLVFIRELFPAVRSAELFETGWRAAVVDLRNI